MDGRTSFRFTPRLVQGTETDDAEGRICWEHPHRPDAAQVEAALAAFTGEIEQTPPLYSAIKVGGQRAYDLARAQTDFELKPRRVTVHALTLDGPPDRDHAAFEVNCGTGTPLGSLAPDLRRAERSVRKE